MSSVRTVVGDIPEDRLGAVDCHEHAFQVSPLLPGDELDDPVRSELELASLRDSGFAAMIDATPIGLGRRPLDLARISRSTGLTVIATTGIHRDEHYASGCSLLELGAEQRSELFLRDLCAGMPVDDALPSSEATTVRAGMLKVGIDYWAITPSEHRTIEAIALAHQATSAPVMVHLEFCTAAHEVLDLLGELGVPADSVLLAHADRAPDAGLHRELVQRGAYLGYDGMARSRTRTDEELIELTARVLGSDSSTETDGHPAARDRILLGGDVARARRYVAYGGMPGLAYLGDRYVPRLCERIGAADVQRLLVENPRHLLARDWASPHSSGSA